MKIVIKTTNIKLNPELADFIERKINDLEHFSKIFQERENYFGHFFGKGKPKVEAWVEIGKITEHHKKGPIFRAETQMRFPKKSLRATAVSEDLKLAIVEVKDKLQIQLKKYKEKLKGRTPKF